MDLSTSYTIKAKVTGQDAIGGLNKGLGKLKTTTNNNVAAMNKLRTAAGNAIGALKALAPAISLAAMGKFVNDTLQLGDSLEKMSQKTGLAVPILDKLRQAANLGGTDFKTLSKAMPTLAKNMQDASDGVGTAKDAFDRLGVTVTNNDGSLKSLDQMFFEISDKIKVMDDRTLAAANAAEIFGTGMGAKLIPIMNQGSDAIKNLSTGFTQLSAERMAKFNDDVAQMGEKFNVLKVQLTEAVLPTLTKLVEIIGKGATAFGKLPGPVKAVGVGLALLVPLVVTIVPLLGAMAISIKAIAAIKLGAMFAAIVPAIGGVVAGVGGLIAAFAPLLAGAAIPLAIIGVGALIFKFRDQIWNAMKAIGQALLWPFKKYAQYVKFVFTNVVKGIKAAFNLIPNIVKGAINAATAPIRGFIKMIKRALALLRSFRRKKNKGGSGGGESPKPMATGGMVTSPTLALIGEAGSEYVIPAHKAGAFSRNYLAGMRGGAAIPRFAEGGFVAPQTNVSIQTGAVTQMDGTNFITTNDLASAVQSGIDQTLTLLQSDLRTRRSLGMA